MYFPVGGSARRRGGGSFPSFDAALKEKVPGKRETGSVNTTSICNIRMNILNIYQEV
jgi:hypothetical protein